MSKFLAAAALLCIPCAVQAQAPAPSPAPSYSATAHAYTLPYVRAEDPGKLRSLHVHASINGGPVGSFDVDTGSVGIVISADDVPNVDPNGIPGSITYSSSGIELDGTWTMVTVHFPDAVSDDGKSHPLDVKVQVLAVNKRLCHDMGPNSGKCTPSDHPSSHMMGIGFDRGKEPHPANNVFLNLDEMRAGTLRSGYILETDGVHLGLTANNVGSGFVFQKLQPRDNVPADGPKDWLTAPGGFAVDMYHSPAGVLLMDTGLTNMMISAPGKRTGEVPDGTPITVVLPGNLRYEFKVGDGGPSTPRRVTWVEPRRGVFINTGLRALSNFDYLYDADGGYLALRPRK